MDLKGCGEYVSIFTGRGNPACNRLSLDYVFGMFSNMAGCLIVKIILLFLTVRQKADRVMFFIRVIGCFSGGGKVFRVSMDTRRLRVPARKPEERAAGESSSFK